jgi:hypothetical protein
MEIDIEELLRNTKPEDHEKLATELISRGEREAVRVAIFFNQFTGIDDRKQLMFAKKIIEKGQWGASGVANSFEYFSKIPVKEHYELAKEIIKAGEEGARGLAINFEHFSIPREKHEELAQLILDKGMNAAETLCVAFDKFVGINKSRHLYFAKKILEIGGEGGAKTLCEYYDYFIITPTNDLEIAKEIISKGSESAAKFAAWFQYGKFKGIDSKEHFRLALQIIGSGEFGAKILAKYVKYFKFIKDENYKSDLDNFLKKQDAEILNILKTKAGFTEFNLIEILYNPSLNTDLCR